MHLKRLGIALVVLPLVYFYITKLSTGYFLFLIVVVAAIAQYEFFSMYNIKGFLRYLGIVFGIGILMISGVYFSKASVTDLVIFLFILTMSIRLFSKRNPASSLYDIAVIVVSVFYIPLLLGYQIYLREHGAEWIVFLYGCIWAADSLAYYIGSSIGKTKLYEEISPNKTVAGAVASVTGGGIGAVILKLAFIYSLSLSLLKAVILGLIIGAVAVVGDLVESMFKRDAGVKDSGDILPGHGGILDKIDSMLFAAPVLYWIAITFKLTQ